jgi:tripartite-type tricarboxylate transporter receptor subunit TctC
MNLHSFVQLIIIVSLGPIPNALAAETSTNQFPLRPIKVIVPYGPGGGSDIIIRALQNKVAENLGQSLIIENKPGASTILGTDIVAKSTADGYTALIVDIAFLVNPGLFAKLPYDSQKDFIPVVFGFNSIDYVDIE